MLYLWHIFFFFSFLYFIDQMDVVVSAGYVLVFAL